MRPASPPAKESQVVDPVCGEVFPPRLATFFRTHEGTKVWFCSSACQSEFDADPEAYPPLDPEDVA